MQFVCPCGERLTFTAQMVGKKGKCPKCGRVTLIDAAVMGPRGDLPTAPVASPALPTAPAPARSIVTPVQSVIQPAPAVAPPAPTITPAVITPQRSRAPLVVGISASALLLVVVSVVAALWASGAF